MYLERNPLITKVEDFSYFAFVAFVVAVGVGFGLGIFGVDLAYFLFTKC